MDENSFIIPWDGSGDEWHSAAAVPDAYKSGWWKYPHAPAVLARRADRPRTPAHGWQNCVATSAGGYACTRLAGGLIA